MLKHNLVIMFVIVVSFLTGCASLNTPSQPHGVNHKAYNFQLPDQNGNQVKLTEVLDNNKGAVIAFYPKDNSKNWIKEFVEFQQNINKLKSRNIKVLGLSTDSSKSHRKFISKHDLNDLTLLSDPEKRVTEIYGAGHWILPVASRVYFIVDSNREIIFKKDTGLSVMEQQTEKLLTEIDKHIL